MKNIVVDRGNANHEEIAPNRAISIFIINTKGELLLTKKADATSIATIWHVPYFLYNTHASNVLIRAQEYLQTLGITECELYEAFTLTKNTHKTLDVPFDEGHVIIAMVTNEDSAIHFSTSKYQWVAVNKILSDTDHAYTTHSESFRETLESVILYVKNILRATTTLSSDIRHKTQ